MWRLLLLTPIAPEVRLSVSCSSLRRMSTHARASSDGDGRKPTSAIVATAWRGISLPGGQISPAKGDQFLTGADIALGSGICPNEIPLHAVATIALVGFLPSPSELARACVDILRSEEQDTERRTSGAIGVNSRSRHMRPRPKGVEKLRQRIPIPEVHT